MNQYQIRKIGYKDDEDYIRKQLTQMGIPFSVTVYGGHVDIDVKINGITMISYKFKQGEIIEQRNHIPRIDCI